MADTSFLHNTWHLMPQHHSYEHFAILRSGICIVRCWVRAEAKHRGYKKKHKLSLQKGTIHRLLKRQHIHFLLLPNSLSLYQNGLWSWKVALLILLRQGVWNPFVSPRATFPTWQPSKGHMAVVCHIRCKSVPSILSFNGRLVSTHTDGILDPSSRPAGSMIRIQRHIPGRPKHSGHNERPKQGVFKSPIALKNLNNSLSKPSGQAGFVTTFYRWTIDTDLAGMTQQTVGWHAGCSMKSEWRFLEKRASVVSWHEYLHPIYCGWIK